MCRGSEVLREVAWVIFDEVHYMQDRERGVVWEETIIFLPPETKMVCACFSGPCHMLLLLVFGLGPCKLCMLKVLTNGEAVIDFSSC